MISKYIMWWISGGMCKVGVLFFIFCEKYLWYLDLSFVIGIVDV